MTGTTTGAMRADAGLRVLRSAAFAAVCTAVSAAGHALVSGAGTPVGPLAAGWAVTLLLVLPLAGRERSRAGITATLLCGQVVLHVLFSVGQFHAAAPDPAALSAPSPAPGVHALQHALHAHGTGAHIMPDPAMFAVHLAAALLFGRVLHRGEHAVWRTLRAAARTVLPPGSLLAAVAARPAPRPRPQVPVSRRSAERPAGLVLLGGAVLRRGPPAPTTA